MTIYHSSSSSSKGGRVGPLRLLFFLALFASEAVGRLVESPHHVVLTPMVCILANLFLMFFTILWRLFLPSLVLFLLTPDEHIVLVLLLLALVVSLPVSFVHNGAELGVQLELAFKRVKGGCHHHNLLVVWGLGSQESLCLEPVVLVLGGGHEGVRWKKSDFFKWPQFHC